MDKRIEEIRARCEAARPAPWEVCNANEGGPMEHGPFWVVCSAIMGEDEEFVEMRVGDYPTAQFVADSREVVPILLHRIARLETELERLTRERDAAVKDINAMLRRDTPEQICQFCKHKNVCSTTYDQCLKWAAWRGTKEG